MYEEKELTGNARDSGGITKCLPQYTLTAIYAYHNIYLPQYTLTAIYAYHNIHSPQYTLTAIYSHRNTCSPRYTLTSIYAYLNVYPPFTPSSLPTFLAGFVGVEPELDKQYPLASCCLLIGYGQREALGLPRREVEVLPL